MMDVPLTLAGVLARAGRLFPDQEIVSRRPDKTVARQRFKDFHDRAHALKAALRRAGLAKGEAVATLMWNNAAHLEAYFGIPLAGGVLLTLNLRLHPDELGYIAGHAGAKTIIVDDILLPLALEIRERTPIRRIIAVNWNRAALPADVIDYETFIGGPWDTEIGPIAEGDAAGMCFTSGTTGRPKGVVYSHRAIVLHSFAIALPDVLAISHRSSVMPVVPMFHANAWGEPFACAMLGAKLVLPGPHLDAESLLDLCESERVTMAAGVPTVWLAVVRALDAEPRRWPGLAGMRVLVGGSAAPESLLRDIARHGMTPAHGWGMTEMTPVGAIHSFKTKFDAAPEDERFRHLSNQGLPLPLVETRIVDDAGEAPWDGKSVGELQVRGPFVAAAYHNQPDAADRWTEDGWFKTGDVAAIDADGYLKLTDRTKDLVKSGGEWISSVDLENAIMGHPAVVEAAVVAVKHPKWDERPLAAVVLKPGQHLDLAALREFLAPKFPKYWLPDALVAIDQIPRTATGKFQKSVLRERFKDWSWA
jgi:fatty-acyl-CoA synthase